MIVSSTDIQNNFGEYLKLCQKEDIIITRNGKKEARLTKYRRYDDLLIREDSAAYNFEPTRLSYEEFLEMSENNEQRFEYIDGEVYLLASPTITHQRVIRNIFSFLIAWFEEKKCEPLTSPIDVTLYKDGSEPNTVQPDIIVICDSENTDEKNRYLGTPSIIFEVVSESSRKKDYVLKLNLYMSSGVGEYWIVNPDFGEVIVNTFKDRNIKCVHSFKNTENARSELFQGLEIPLSRVLA